MLECPHSYTSGFLEHYVDKNVSMMPVILMSHTAVPPQ